jgi:histidyl-tRNA synthetase
VRGLDYYTRTVFEFTSSALGAQSTVCGGGRYDDLVERSADRRPRRRLRPGARAVPDDGAGVAGERAAAPRAQAIALGAGRAMRLVPIVAALRTLATEPTFADWQDRKLTAHFKTADRNGARWALILGDEELATGEIVLRDLLARRPAAPAPRSAAEVARVLGRSHR